MTSYRTAAHSPACIATHTTCAIENLRDSENPDWNITTPGINPITIALDYLATGTCTCICGADMTFLRT